MEKKCVHKFLKYFSVFLRGMIEATGCCGFNDNNVTCMLVRNGLFIYFKGCMNCMCFQQNWL